ncbi:hypothetical protein V6Z12_A05G310600 [Gossypium hirsutum]|uniref:Uncharacterized protein isoform X3 n=1 Tax=Gossypium hirsutum TaxID=3635 RepID=A0ABM3BMF5_GOSHI|nr:uncharacterized protein LOC107904376 isoform X3 [Gossypium hirsutum]
MRLTSPSLVYRGIFTMFLVGSRYVSGKVLKQHQGRRLQQLLLKRQILMTNISALSLKEQDEGVYRKSRNAIQTRLQMAMEVRDSLEIAHTPEEFSKLYAGIVILWLHLSLNQPSLVYCFFFFSDLFPLINES